MKDYKVFGIDAKLAISILLGIIIFLISFRAPGVSRAALDYSVPPIISLVQNYSLIVVTLLLFCIVLIFTTKSYNLHPKHFSSAIINFYIFQQILAITDIYYEEDILKILTVIIFNTLIFFSFGYIIKVIYNTPIQIQKFFQIIYLGIFFFISVNAILYFGNFGNVVWKGRFFGVTSQPNFIGMCGGLSAVFSMALLLNEVHRRKRILYLSGLILSFLVCYWSGSRSSLLSTVAGCSVIYLLTFKTTPQKIVVAILALIFVTVLSLFFDPTTIDYTERGNTRENTWKQLYSIVLELPILGLGSKATATTNSYMYAIATAGIAGSFFLFKSIYKILAHYFTNKGILSCQRSTYYIFKGVVTFLLVGAVFEGFLLDSAGMPVFMFWILASFGK